MIKKKKIFIVHIKLATDTMIINITLSLAVSIQFIIHISGKVVQVS